MAREAYLQENASLSGFKLEVAHKLASFIELKSAPAGKAGALH